MTPKQKVNTGQALIEICVCMIGVVVVLLAMLELTKIGMLHTTAMSEARAEVARIMQSETVLFATPDFLQTWDEGPDSKRYTADDTPVTASSASFYNSTVERSVADAAQWNILRARPNRIVDLHNAQAIPAAFFGLLKGDASETTSLLPGFQKMVYRADAITVESEIWMTWTKGIY